MTEKDQIVEYGKFIYKEMTPPTELRFITFDNVIIFLLYRKIRDKGMVKMFPGYRTRSMCRADSATKHFCEHFLVFHEFLLFYFCFFSLGVSLSRMLS